ncbi:MAG: ParA family protein [Bacteroidales bacterium]|nr:ParA family protein [Bacteroidales bacterium]
MSKIITIANSKGGVGKTTTSIYLATLLSEYGSVLLKDSDPQGSATEWVEDIEEMPFDFELTNQRQMGKTKGYNYVVIDTHLKIAISSEQRLRLLIF